MPWLERLQAPVCEGSVDLDGIATLEGKLARRTEPPSLFIEARGLRLLFEQRPACWF